MAFNNDPNFSAQDPDDIDSTAKELNSLLAGEISAIETYRQVIDSVADKDDSLVRDRIEAVRDMAEDHIQAAAVLRERVRDLGAEPVEGSGAWGVWARTVQGTMNLFGDTSALKGLKEGEEHGLKDYRDACDEVDGTSGQLIVDQLIPNQERHIDLLDRLIASAGRA